jgi:hypothetical protein
MPTVRIKRGTRAQINAAAAANGLRAGEPYLITDEARLAVGTSDSTYQAAAKQGEGGGSGGSQQVFVQQTRPAEPGPWAWWVTNATGAVVNLIVNDGA